jgi:hypothetical protein
MPKLWGDGIMISADRKKIFDPATKSLIDMPTEANEQKIALEKVFFHITRLLFFRHGFIKATNFFKKVPQELEHPLYVCTDSCDGESAEQRYCV